MATIAEALQVALQYQRAGNLPQAELIYRQILQVEPEHVHALFLLGILAHQCGKNDLALPYLDKAIALDPSQASFHNIRGGVFRALGKRPEARVCFAEALRLQPGSADAYVNLGDLCQEEGRLDEARAHYREALRLKPDYAEAHNNLGNVWKAQGRLDQAATCYQQALHLRPDWVGAHNNLGIVYQQRGQCSEAIACFQEALRRQPDYAEARYNLGNVYRDQGRWHEALACYQEAVRQKPNLADGHNGLGSVLQSLGRPAEAAASFRQALRLNPDLAEAHNNLGNVYRNGGQSSEALACYRQALRLKPDCALAHVNLGNVLVDQGKTAEALACFTQALEIAPRDGLRIKTALVTPLILESVADLHRVRKQLEENVAGLLEAPLAVEDPLQEVGSAQFFTAYHGMNDRDLHARLADIFARATPALCAVAPHCRTVAGTPAGQRPIRIGFISKFFYDHSVGKFYSGVLRHLSRDDFHVLLFRFPGNDDSLSRHIQASADRVVTLSPHLPDARGQIAGERLDILFYTDVGMDPWTYFLAFARLAPVQCVGSGHPVTTGVPAIDYFLSAVDLEPEDADGHYTERLVRMRHFPFYFYPPRVESRPRARAEFGLDDTTHVYLCAQALFKIHPDFDCLLGEILQADPLGRAVFFEGNQPEWTGLLLERFRRTFPEGAERVQFLPRQPAGDFLQVLARANVLLDTIHFSGGTSSFESLAAGTPIVTLPAKYMRGRVTYACYRKMGVLDCVAADPEDYVRKAVRLGTDPDYNAAIRARILAANHVLYDNPAGVRELEQFFIGAVIEARNPTAT